MDLETTRFDASEYLDTREAMATFLEDAFASGNPELITHSLGIVAKAKGMTELARETGLTRQALYKALSAEGQPELTTVLKVVRALGLRLQPVMAEVAG